MINKKNVKSKTHVLIAILIFPLLLSACGGARDIQYQSASHQVTQSQNDTREYKVIKLPNKLELILVSDPSLDRSAVALAVKAGSYDESNGFWGQAHFLEHMLFLGTEKYPENGSFNTFISSNGGVNNAYTYMDHTNYMATIKNDAFEELLDRFTDYFKAPLLSADYINKERNAVHSEWSMKGVYDGVVLGHLNGLTLNQSHPAANFTWGNLSSLKDQNGQTLHQATIDFYNKYYHANRMKVAIVSNRSIRELKDIVKKHFADIKGNNREKPVITTPVITSAQTKKIIRYRPKKDLKKIQLKFVIEDNSRHFLSKPNYFVSYLLNSEMPGTLISILKTEGLIEGLSAWADPSAFGNAGEFVIDIDLTEQGLRQRDIIISTVFKYLSLINTKGISRKYYQEIKKSLKNSFDYQSKYSEYNYAANLAAKMHKVPTQYVLSADYEFSHFSPRNIMRLLAQLSIDNVRVFFIDKQQEPKQQISYFDAKYQIDDISPEQVKRWKSINNHYSLSLPELNPLLPERFDLVKKNLQTTPIKIISPLGSVLHIKHSEYFSVAKGGINVNLNTDLGTKSATEQALLKLLQQALTEKLSTLNDQAYNAGMSLRISPQLGLTFITSGFSDKQLELQSAAINEFATIDFTEKAFNQWKTVVRSSLQNQSENALYSQAFELYNTFLIEGKYTDKEQLAVLEKIQLADLIDFTERFIRSAQLNTFAFGNFEQSQLTSFISSVEQLLNMKAADKQIPLYYTQYYKFNDNERINLKIDAQQNDVALIDAKWQESSITKEAIGKVLAKIVSPALFKQLRTEEQLGYSVGFYSTVKNKQITYAWYIQTPVKSPTKMLTRFNAFQTRFSDNILMLSDAELDKYRQAVLVPLAQQVKNIYQEQDEYLSDWLNGDLSFDSKDKLIEAIEEVTVSEVQQLYQQIIDPAQFARVIVQIKGNNFAKQPFIEIDTSKRE